MSYFPQLGFDETVELTRRLDARASGNVDFYMTMVLSTALASLGLLQNSVPVVIGAMIVAPLMGPLVAAGLALVEVDGVLFRKGVIVTCVGIVVGFCISLLFGLMKIGFEPTLEIEARGTPDLLDLGIAFFSGMTAAYALSRAEVMNVIAGVAIAAALVPPLAVIGIAVGSARYIIAGNATILLVTNVVAIILGAALVFRLMGVSASESECSVRKWNWARKAVMLLSLFSVLLVAPLFVSMLREARVGQNRPHSYPVSPRVRRAVNDYVDNWPSVELIVLARSSVEPRTDMSIILSSTEQVAPEFEDGLREAVFRVRRDFPAVRIFVLRSGFAEDDTAGRLNQYIPVK